MPNGLDNISWLSVLGTGFLLGMKHALDADHLIAVSALTRRNISAWGHGLIGGLWGAGHTLALVIVASAVIVSEVRIPDSVASFCELSVALMLIVMGGRIAWKLIRGARIHLHPHAHLQRVHLHPHLHSPKESADQADHHRHTGRAPLLVGMVHGFAGSSSLMLLVLATISSKTLAFAYVGIFGLGSVGGMVAMSMLVGIPLAALKRHESHAKVLQWISAGMSIAFGCMLAWQTGIHSLVL